MPEGSMPIRDRKLLITEQLAKHLELSPRTLERWRREGSGPPWLEIGGCVRYDPADIEEWKAARRNDPKKVDIA
jgi:predicted DNA-binding transcriptional regulator AlpA